MVPLSLKEDGNVGCYVNVKRWLRTTP